MMETASLYLENKNNNTNDKGIFKIISRKNSINMKRKDKVKLLAQATEMGEEELVAALLKKKKNIVNVPNHVGRYPLHSAAQLGNLKIASLLLDGGADINAIESTSKWTVLHFAALSKNKEMFHMLLSQPSIAVAEKGNREGNTALHYYARNFSENYQLTIEMLLQKGALIDAQNLNGETPLHNACWKGHEKIVRSLIDNRANINSLNDHGETPLHWAARMGYIEIVKILLEAGANPNVHGTTGTPLEVTPPNESSIRDLLQRAIQALQPQLHPQLPLVNHDHIDMPLSIKRKASPFQWEIAYTEMKLTAKIGEGSFSDVFLGTWRGIEVAVKMLKNALSAESFEAFLQEISLVSKLRHPNVVLFLGACLDGPAVCYVTEFIPNGTLYDLLKKETELDWLKKLSIAIEIARGMQYLHSHKVLHGDLKSLNLLVDENYHIKVADFGLSKIMEEPSEEPDQQPNSGGNRRKYKGTLTWQGPEVVNELSEYTEKSDVYSFGIVMWELISHRAPYEGLDSITVLRYIDQGELPEMPSSCPPEFAQLIRSCCAREPADRPDFNQILEQLKTIRSNSSSSLPESDPTS